MKNILLLSWFYSNKHFNRLIARMLREKKICNELYGIYRKHENEIKSLKAKLFKENIWICTYVDKLYPENLKNLEYSPWVFCGSGNLSLLEESLCLGVVGSRKPDLLAVHWLKEEFKKLNKKVVIVSGGAIGIDQVAHQEAFLQGISNICVLPVGIFNIYPQSLKKNMNKYLESGKFLFISQFHPEQKVCKSLFHSRNYLLSALSNKILIVQAKKNSGTMITAKYAIDQGKEIYALPANPWDDRYMGNVQLLEDGAYQVIDLSLVHL